MEEIVMSFKMFLGKIVMNITNNKILKGTYTE